MIILIIIMFDNSKYNGGSFCGEPGRGDGDAGRAASWLARKQGPERRKVARSGEQQTWTSTPHMYKYHPPHPPPTYTSTSTLFNIHNAHEE